MTTSITRPILKYYGGKFKLAPWIISHFPPHEVYLEPFGGAASVLLLKDPARYEIYNDLNNEVVNVFEVLRDETKALLLKHLLELTPYARTEWMRCFEPSTDKVEQARRTIVKSLLSVGNSQESNTPKGFRCHSKNYHYLPEYFAAYVDHINLFTMRLKNVTIENTDALKLMLKNDRIETLFYVDPPYLNRRRMDHGYTHEMKTDQDHELLLSIVHDLKGMVLLSGYDNELYRDMLPNWTMVSKMATTGSRTKGKCSAREILFINPACAEKIFLL